MTATSQPLKLFRFPRMFGVPNLSPSCCKLERWLRIARIPYEVTQRCGKHGAFIPDDPRPPRKRQPPALLASNTATSISNVPSGSVAK
jgi:hypothetical protein